MGYPILVSTAFQRFFERLEDTDQTRVRDALHNLAKDSYTPRPGADIKPLANTTPKKHRLRVGPWRIVYRVEDEGTVKVIDGFQRGRGDR